MSPPPLRHRPSNSSGIASAGWTAIGSAPARRIASRYWSRATTQRGAVCPHRVTAIRGPIHVHGIRFSGARGGLAAHALAIDQFHEHTVRRARVKECDETFDATTRRVINELDTLAREANERAREVIDDEAEVVQRGPSALGHEARDAGVRISRLEQLDAGAVARREGDTYALVGDDKWLVDAIAEDVAVEGDRLGQRGHGDRDVMQLPRGDPLHERGGWYTPKTVRRSAQISPSVTLASTHATIGGTRFAVPRPAGSRSPRARPAASRPGFMRHQPKAFAPPTRDGASDTLHVGTTE